MDTILSGTSVQPDAFGPAPLADNERVVQQYGPEWIEHVTAGGAVRHGNILTTE